MASSSVNIRMDADIKREFENICSDIGMNVTTAINIFAKKVVRERRMPFELTAAPAFNAKTLAAMEEAEALASDRKAKRFTSVDELLADLDS